MKSSDIIASIGVIILLIAFMLNLYKRLPATSRLYSLMNFIGAGLCCYASWMVSFYPFIILEGVWAFVALVSLFKVSRGTSADWSYFVPFHVKHGEKMLGKSNVMLFVAGPGGAKRRQRRQTSARRCC